VKTSYSSFALGPCLAEAFSASSFVNNGYSSHV